MKKSFVFPLVLLFCAITGLSGCGAGGVSKADHGQAVKGVDPFAYGDEFALHTVFTGNRDRAAKTEPVKAVAPAARKEAAATATMPSATVDSSAVPASPETKSPPNGTVYRVQIGIYEERKSAEQRAGEARSKVSLPVYVEFEPPFYRVRVGDFKTREEAEQQVKVLQNEGFRGSFWVMKNIGTP